jgi:low affinity Fe/Cu permease
MSPTLTKPNFFKISLIALIFFLLIFTIVEKIILFYKFSIVYTDGDQCILWLAADELMKGHIPEPGFFGQAYNSCLEGWLAVPFVACGMPLHAALPLTTIMMSVLPFLLLAFHFYSRGNYLIVVTVFLCALGFSLDYKLISILPRGFITGVFCFGIAYFLLLKQIKYKFFWFSLFAFFGVVFNEMSFFLVFPVLFLEWLKNLKTVGFYYQTIPAFVLAGSYKLYIYLFYNVLHPEYNHYVKTMFVWKLTNLMDAINHLDTWFFNGFTLILCCTLSILAFLIVKKQYKESATIIITLLFLLLSFGLSRVHDGVDSIMYSKGRVYVFLPLLIAVFFSLCNPLFQLKMKWQFYISSVIFVCICSNVFIQQSMLDKKIEREVLRTDKVVSFMTVKDVFKVSQQYIDVCKETNNTIIVYDWYTSNDFILYLTIPLLSDNSVRTFFPECDRRAWVFIPFLAETPKKILVSGNCANRYTREGLKRYTRRIIKDEGTFCLVEYILDKPLKETIVEDFEISLRIH